MSQLPRTYVIALLALAVLLTCVVDVDGGFIRNRGGRDQKQRKGKVKGIDDEDMDVSDFKVKDNKGKIKVNGRGEDGKKVNKEKLNQYFRGVPIFGASIVVEYEEDDVDGTDPFVDYGVYYEKSYLQQYIQNTQTSLDDDDLHGIIADDYGRSDFTASCEQWIYFVEDVPYFSFMCNVIGEGGGGVGAIEDAPKDSSIYHWLYVIDAKQGAVLAKINKMAGALKSDTAGNPRLGFKTISRESTSTGLANADVYVQTYNYGTSSATTITCSTATDCETADKDRNGGQGTAMLAFEYAAGTYECFRALTVDGSPPVRFQLPVRVHYDTDYDGAFWDGQAIYFGDGSYFYPLVCADVMAHELAHGFTNDGNSQLLYWGEPGAIDEAFSDLAGVTCAKYIKQAATVDWRIGADIYKTAGKAMRYMNNPPQDGWSIDNYADYRSGMDVHYSSGVFNKAFYNMVQNGLSVEQVFKVASYANMMYWTSTTSMTQAAVGMVDAADDLGIDSAKIETAFIAVGVTWTDLACGSTETGTVATNKISSLLFSSSTATSFILNGCASSFDTVFKVYRTDSNTKIAENDDDSSGHCSGAQSYVQFNAASGYTGDYRLDISGYAGAGGSFSVTLTCSTSSSAKQEPLHHDEIEQLQLDDHVHELNSDKPDYVMDSNLGMLLGLLVVFNIGCTGTVLYCFRHQRVGPTASVAKYEAVKVRSEAKGDHDRDVEQSNLI